ncbi:MAG: hypothetical protein ABIA37_00465 [Candidatus Woesearchaeota archaeon]
MAKIIFEDTGKNYQVPGLPYTKVSHYVNPIILDEVPTVRELERLLEYPKEDTFTNPWSLSVVKGFRDYIPTTFKRVTQKMEHKLIDQYFDDQARELPEEKKVLLQLQTEIEAKAATIDAAIVHSRRDIGTVVNKAHALNRVYKIGRIFKHLKKRDYPFLFGDLTDEGNWNQALSSIKQQFIEFLLEIPQGERRHGKKIRKVDTSQREIEKRFVYVDWLKEKLGDDLQGILLYGSAARTDNPEEYNDFDNWVRVKDVPRAHKILAETCPSVLEGKVVKLTQKENEKPKDAKHVGIHIFPDSEEYIIRHIKFLHDSREFLKHTKVLYGEFPFIKVKQDEVIERGVSQAYLKLKTIASSLNWAYSDPETIYGKPSLFEFIVKNVRFFLQHSLNAIEGPCFRGKEELNDLLAQRGIYIPEYKDDLDYIRSALLSTTVNVFQLQKEFQEYNREPKLDFLIEKKRFEWNAPDIDEWGPYADGT